jgi:septum formation protein
MVSLVLASRSRRRMEVLDREGVAYRAVEAPFEDPPQPPQGHAAEIAGMLALRKAESARDAFPEACRHAAVLAADTICTVDGRSIGTPVDVLQARTMLATMVDRWHGVVTGVAILHGPRRVVFADEARVWLGSPGLEVVEAYLQSGGWRGRAGAYDLDDRLRAGWPIRCEGDPDTVAGLPWKRVVSALETLA